ncbi:hypothetical protein O5552_14430 [Escherichia coli]|nr:hypothetical protein [Escherichia coli]
MMGLIPAGSIPITTIPSDHEMRLDVISKWINALIRDNQSDWFISTMHQNWLQIEKRETKPNGLKIIQNNSNGHGNISMHASRTRIFPGFIL